MEGTSGGLFSTTCSKPAPGHVAEGFIQSSLEKHQGLELHSVSEQPVSLFDCSLCEKAFLSIRAEPDLFQSMLVLSCSPTMHHLEEHGLVFSIISSQVKRILGPPEARLTLLHGVYFSSA